MQPGARVFGLRTELGVDLAVTAVAKNRGVFNRHHKSNRREGEAAPVPAASSRAVLVWESITL